MFVLFFAIFIFVLTVWENIFLVGMVFVALFIGLFIRQKFRWHVRKIDDKIFLKRISLLALALLLSMGSYIFYNNFRAATPAEQRNFIGTGVIQDTYTQGKYIFSDGKSTYVLYSSKDFQIGDIIFLAGRKSSGAFSGSATEQGFLAFDYAKWLKMKGRQGVIYESNSYKISHASLGRIRQTKNILQQKIISAYGKNKITGLILGMLIGDRSQIPKDDYQNFINSGLVHLIAVSGGNIVMIVVFLGLVLFFVPFYARSAVILLTIIFYGLLCGMDSSVLRAVIAGGLSLLALFRGKDIPIRRLMAIAFIGMLMINPYYLVYDVGFLMSFGAVIGIILLSKRNNEKKGELVQKSKIEGWTENSGIIGKGVNYIWKNYLQPSVGATFGVFPIIIFFMGQINLLSIIGNLFVLPIVAFVMIYGFISVFLYQLLGRNRLLMIEKMLITYIYKISEISSAFGLYLSAHGWIKRALLSLFLIGFIAWRSGATFLPGGKVKQGAPWLQSATSPPGRK